MSLVGSSGRPQLRKTRNMVLTQLVNLPMHEGDQARFNSLPYL